MSSDQQIEANRRNAQLSTGPRSAEGKARVALNAVRHGLSGKQMVLPGEDPAEFDQFREAFFNDLNQQGALEQMLVEKLVADAWRLRRVPAMEVTLYKRGYKEGSEDDSIIPIRALMLYPRDFASLERHEIALSRSFSRTLHDLQRLQAQRAGQHVTAPAMVDVDVNVGENGAPLEALYKTNPN